MWRVGAGLRSARIVCRFRWGRCRDVKVVQRKLGRPTRPCLPVPIANSHRPAFLDFSLTTSIIERPARSFRGYEGLALDQFTFCHPTADQQWLTHSFVRGQHALTVSPFKRRRSSISTSIPTRCRRLRAEIYVDTAALYCQGISQNEIHFSHLNGSVHKSRR